MSLTEAVGRALAGHAGPVAVAVSGGGDSMALLDLAAGVVAPGQLHAVTVDHGLRSGSAEEAAGVARYCATRAIPHATLRWQGWDGQGNLQAAARGARYRLMADWAESRGIHCILLAHSRDDVAETFLMRLGRASGLEGLARMAPVFLRHGVTWRRPLLDIGREDLRNHLRERGIHWVEDPSNSDPRFDRVRARAALAALAPLGVTAEAIAHSATALAAARQGQEARLAGLWAARLRLDGGDLLLDAADLATEDLRGLLLRALRIVGAQDWPPRHTAMADLLARLAGDGQHTLAGCLATRRGAEWRIAREWQAVRDLVAVPGQLWDGRWQMVGPVLPGAEIRALGEGIALCPDWRASGLPRASVMAGPAVWQENVLIAAPLAANNADWQAKLRPDFASWPVAH